MWFKASAPGSLMLLGEYAVLEGYPALVCAMDKRISVTLVPRADENIVLNSHLGTIKTRISDIHIVKPFEFVLTTLKKYQPYFQQGFDITIEAEFSNTIGFASSAAVTVATLSVLSTWLDLSFSLNKMVSEAREMIRTVQGVGSGADVAAAVYGGIIAYQPHDLGVEKFCDSYPLTVIYSGSKTPTPQAIHHVKQLFTGKEKVFTHIIQKIGECAEQGIRAMIANNWKALGEIMNEQQTQMHALGVTTPMLDNILKAFYADDAILGAKISGSGLGDCAIGLGKTVIDVPGASLIPVEMTDQGVFCEHQQEK